MTTNKNNGTAVAVQENSNSAVLTAVVVSKPDNGVSRSRGASRSPCRPETRFYRRPVQLRQRGNHDNQKGRVRV